MYVCVTRLLRSEHHSLRQWDLSCVGTWKLLTELDSLPGTPEKELCLLSTPASGIPSARDVRNSVIYAVSVCVPGNYEVTQSIMSTCVVFFCVCFLFSKSGAATPRVIMRNRCRSAFWTSWATRSGTMRTSLFLAASSASAASRFVNQSTRWFVRCFKIDFWFYEWAVFSWVALHHLFFGNSDHLLHWLASRPFSLGPTAVVWSRN